ncbi:hypothetical protein FRC12_017115 [Ceratobasidium sp. 428]|nr:hypothetical protein FRC12_017115 [Ceratobasidium sp. 428]
MMAALAANPEPLTQFSQFLAAQQNAQPPPLTGGGGGGIVQRYGEEYEGHTGTIL